MNGALPPSEAEYTRAAHQALDRGELRLAFVQIAGALSYRPNAPELRGLLEVALARSKQPLSLLPSKGDAFFGVGAVRAAALMRAGKLGDAIVQLLDVVTFRPSAPFLLWLDEWRARGLRGVRVEEVAAAARKLIAGLFTNAEPRSREVEAAKAKARSAERFGTKAGSSS